jgi:hypothetical protein
MILQKPHSGLIQLQIWTIHPYYTWSHANPIDYEKSTAHYCSEIFVLACKLYCINYGNLNNLVCNYNCYIT